MSIIENHLAEFEKTIEHFKSDINGLKTGRANPAILDGIVAEAYGVKTPLNQLASISVPEARSIIIQPWDRNITKEIEKAIRESELEVSVANEGERIRLTISPMTEESRKEIVKHLHQKMEQARIAARAIRDEIKEEIIQAEKNKEFGEDERYRLIEELDKKTGEYNEKIKSIGEKKEREIMTV